MEKILRVHKYLQVYNKNYITDRLQELTDGDMFLAFNGFTKMYELHSIKSFKKNRESLQASFMYTDLFNEWLIRDIQASSMKKFGDEIQSYRQYLESLNEKQDESNMNIMLDESIKEISYFLGGNI